MLQVIFNNIKNRNPKVICSVLSKNVINTKRTKVSNLNNRQILFFNGTYFRYNKSDLNEKQIVNLFLKYTTIRHVTIFKSLNVNDVKFGEDDTGDLNRIHKQFPEPKVTLHNYFQMLSGELKEKKYALTKPQYKHQHTNKKTKGLWSCTYKLLWPEEIKFESTSNSKQDASKKAALKALNYLKRLGKISKDGYPVIYQKKEIVDANKPISLQLNNTIVDKLQTIRTIYEKNLSSKINSDLEMNTNIKYNFDEIRTSLPSKFFQRNAEMTTNLPIAKFKELIVRTINENQVTIIKGEPGCGKSTQVPQYIYDHWFDNGDTDYIQIVVSEPRRIAATSLAEEVSTERNESLGETVGYHVRFDSSYNPDSGAILYCTSGILLKRVQVDPELRSVTHVVLDEAHERDVNTDLLMVLLRKALTKNPNLKIIIMSATMNVEFFQNYFNNAPVVEIPGLSYPVKSYFLDDLNYLKLNKTLEMSESENPTIVPEDITKIIQWIHRTKDDGSILCFLPGWDDIMRVKTQLERNRYDNKQVILPLHSKLSMKDQKQIFQNYPPGIRKIILSTNIAETSVTINDVVYVIDTGAHKEQRLDKTKERECIDNYWISQSNVLQRRGRAGRVRPGEAYHLFTKAKFAEMEKFQLPNILRVSLTKLVLDTKVYDLEMRAIEFLQQLPDPPELQAIQKAVNELISLNVIDENEHLTPLGRIIALFSLSPALSKSLMYSYFFNCVTPVTDIITVLSSNSELFSNIFHDKSTLRSLKKNLSNDSDHISYHKLMDEWRNISRISRQSAFKWCNNFLLNPHKMNVINRLREVHLNYLTNLNSNLSISDKFAGNNEMIKALLLAGLNKVLFSKIGLNRKHQRKLFVLTESGQHVSIASDSVNYKRALSPSVFCCYSNEKHSITRRTTIVRETSIVSPLSILLFSNLFQQHNKDDSLVSFVGNSNSSLRFDLDKENAKLINEVKDIVNNTIQYLCKCHLQCENHVDNEFLQHWEKIIDNLNVILLESSKK